MEHPRGSVLVWLGHPATVVATFVLPVNDHLLKARWPGPVTGKLSDVAGLMVAPPLLALVFSLALALSRLPTLTLSRTVPSSPALAPSQPGPLFPSRAGPLDLSRIGPLVVTRFAALAAIITTGVGFILVKSTGAGAEFASRVWTLVAGPSRVLADPTDLVALPALGVTWLIWRGCQTDQAVRRARALIIVPVALFGVTATSATSPPSTAKQVSANDEVITVVRDHDFVSNETVLSYDGGRTWTVPSRPGAAPIPVSPFFPTPPSPAGPPSPRSSPFFPDSPDPANPPDSRRPTSSPYFPNFPDSPAPGFPRATPPPLAPSPATRVCVPGEPLHCYRVAPPRFAVDESWDGGATWETSWGVSERRERALRRLSPDRPPVAWEGSQAVAVQRVTGGHVVVVANGRDGIAVRDARGTWRRLGFSAEGFSPDTAPPLHLPDVDLGTERLIGFFVGLIAFMAGMAGARRHEPRVNGLAVSAYVLASVGFVLSLPSGGPLPFVLGIACALTAAALTATAAVRARVSVRTWFALLALAPCTSFVIWATFSVWRSGTLEDYSTAGFLAWLAGGAGVGASVLVGWTTARKDAGHPAA